MSIYCIIPKKSRALVFLIVITGLSFFTNSLSAQANGNVSYNANSIPINGAYNSVFGIMALANNISGESNVALGSFALQSNTTGTLNSAIGDQSLITNTTGNGNCGFGPYALYFNTTGRNNTATGYQALVYNSSGNYNTAIGDSSGFYSLGNRNVFIGSRAGFRETGSNKLYISNDSTKTLLYGDFSNGQILLGKPNATGYVFKGTRTLNVLGGILTDSMRLAPSANWADKVFKKDYPLKSLKELEHYISVNKHLPGIPTASEVASDGINVADLETKLLEKVEELTLYVLELKKENQQQQEEIDKLKRQMK